MARGMPSMTALLALLAVAGYQNRDKIAEWLGGTGQGKPGAAGQGGIGGLVTQLRNSLGGANAGEVLSGGLGELVDRFKQSGQAETAESLGQDGAQPAVHSGPARAGARPPGAGHVVARNRTVAGRAAGETVPRASRRRRQEHAARRLRRRRVSVPRA